MKMGKLEKQFVNSDSHSQRVSKRAERLLRYTRLEPGVKYLDVGTGNGAAPIYMAQKYDLEVTGVDIDLQQIETAESNSAGMPNVHFFTIDDTQLPFADETFDTVSAFKVTHHIPNWEDAVAEMLRVLKPQGYFIYVDFVFSEWLASLIQRIVKDKAGVPTLPALNLLLADNNLSPIHQSKPFIHYEGVFQKKSL